MKLRKNVILTHGFLNKAPIMAYLVYQLRKLGYRIHFFNYKTLHFNREETLNSLKRLCDGLDNIYFVGHSMGGLVLREFIQTHPSPKYKAVVTLGTPHQTSSFAKHVSSSELNNLLGINEESGLISDLRDYEGIPPLGSIAGNKGDTFLNKIKGIQEESDGTILVEETRGVNFSDHIVLHLSHSTLLLSKEVVSQINYFFNNFKFQRD